MDYQLFGNDFQLFDVAQLAKLAAASPHVALKIPSGDGPYARAKHFQLVEKDLDASIAWFWKAIITRDRLDSALKDMAVVMKQRGFLNEAIDAIKSLRHLCPWHSQDSLDNVLIDLFKASGRTREEIELLKQKLRKIYQGEAFRGRTTKRARSHGRTIHVTVQQEASRLLGNLAWAYMHESNFMAAEVVYRKAQMIYPDANKACNLALCLIELSRFADAEVILYDVLAGMYPAGRDPQDDIKIFRKAEELLARIVAQTSPSGGASDGPREDDDEDYADWVEDRMLALLDVSETQYNRLPVFENISPIGSGREQVAC